MNREGVLIVNTKSRRGRMLFEAARQALTEQGVTLTDVYALQEPGHVPEIARKQIERGIPLVIVGGGDGTLSAVTRYFIGSNSVMGVLPMGTGNQFARDLGIPENMEEACRVVSEGVETAVDVGTVEKDYFLTVTTVGLTSQVVVALTHDLKRTYGRFAYAFAMVRALRSAKPFRARLITDEGEQTVETIQLVVGNGRYHAGPFPLSPQATITDSVLDVYALTDMAPRSLIQFAYCVMRGRHVELPFVSALRTSHLRLETEPSQPVVVDGEMPYHTPVTLGIKAGALRVMAPAASPVVTGEKPMDVLTP